MASDTETLNSELAPTGGEFSTFFVADLFFGVDVLRGRGGLDGRADRNGAAAAGGGGVRT